MNHLITENRMVRRIEKMLETLVVLVVAMSPVFAIVSLGTFPQIGLA